MKRGAHIYCILVIFLILLGCSSTRNNKVLSFFFDGVPQASNPSDSVLLSTNSDNASVSSSLTSSQPTIIYHYPYLEKECGSCHEGRSMGTYTASQPELCYMCHDDFSNQYAYIHGPVAGGYCTVCHNPHQSKNKYLLRKEGREICTGCHRASTLFNTDVHETFGETPCMDCHSPHGGSERTLLY